MNLEPMRFGRFELQPRERRLLVDGVAVALGARAFDLLLTLAARPGQLVTKNELLDEVWPGLVVEEANLSVQVSGLRKVLGGEVIATIPGRGYRFTAPMEHGHAGAPMVPTATGAIAALDSAPATPTAATSPAALAPLRRVAPALTGRDDDLAGIEATLANAACTTLTGLAGVGKTSLARGVAARWAAGAVWVDLAPLDDGAALPSALARTLGVPLPAADPLPALAHALGERLLVLDNAEHVVEDIALLVGELFAARPGLHVLVTSQLPLGLPVERVRRIEPLALPLDSDELDLHRGAVALFVERVQGADHRFRADAASLPLVRDICRSLDGLPLALEMAAVRVPALGLQGVRDALQRRFALLTSGWRHATGRHRTLHAALDWSHALLGAQERRLLRACAVFSGGFSLDLAVAVAGDEAHERWDVIDTLAHLVERSLVAMVYADAAEAPRYRLLETVRAYALEKLAETDEEPLWRGRQARALLDLYARASLRNSGEAEQEAALAEHDNVRQSLAWAREHDPALAVRLAPHVTTVATFSAWRLEAGAWLAACQPLLDDARVTPELRAAWWLEQARQTLMSRDPAARATARHARDLFRALGDERGEFNAIAAIVRASLEPNDELQPLCAEMRALDDRHPEWSASVTTTLLGTQAWACELLGDNETLLQLRLQQLELARRGGLQAEIDATETNVITAMHLLGRDEQALQRCRELLARIGDDVSGNAAYAWQVLVCVLVDLDRFAEVRAVAPRVMALMRRLGMPDVTEALSLMLAKEGRLHDAARWIGHTRAVYAARGRTPELDAEALLARARQIVQGTLDAAMVDGLEAEGRALDAAEADRIVMAGPGAR